MSLLDVLLLTLLHTHTRTHWIFSSLQVGIKSPSLPTLLKNENSAWLIEKSAMVAPRGRGGDRRNQAQHVGQSGCPQCTYCKRMGSYLRELLFFAWFSKQGTSCVYIWKGKVQVFWWGVPRVFGTLLWKISTLRSIFFGAKCFNRFVFLNLWKVKIYGSLIQVPFNILLVITLYFSYLFPKNCPTVTVTNGSKVASQEISQVPLSHLNLNFVLYIPHYPYCLSKPINSPFKLFCNLWCWFLYHTGTWNRSSGWQRTWVTRTLSSKNKLTFVLFCYLNPKAFA